MPTNNQNRLWLLVSMLVLASIAAPLPIQGSTFKHGYDDTNVRLPRDGESRQLDTSTTPPDANYGALKASPNSSTYDCYNAATNATIDQSKLTGRRRVNTILSSLTWLLGMLSVLGIGFVCSANVYDDTANKLPKTSRNPQLRHRQRRLQGQGKQQLRLHQLTITCLNGMMYYRARYYDPNTGEFISRDPLGFVDGMSQYRAYFVPGGVDPLGFSACDCPEERGKQLGFNLPAGHSWGTHHFRNYYFDSNNRDVSLKEIGLYSTFWSHKDVVAKYESVKKQYDYLMCAYAESESCDKKSKDVAIGEKKRVTDVTGFSVLFSIGHSTMKFNIVCEPIELGKCCGKCDFDSHRDWTVRDVKKRSYSTKCTITRTINDEFSKPLTFIGINTELWGGKVYGIDSCYKEEVTFSGTTCDCAGKFHALD